MPKFRDIASWHQANLLMQPAFIRVVDNLRKQLDESVWQGNYVDVLQFPDGTSEADQFKVKQLQAERETANVDRAAEIDQALAELPIPIPGYHLHLTHDQQEITVDIWNLCYQVCFLNYTPTEADEGVVEIDTSLFDSADNLDWNCLDDKTKAIVDTLFANLPKS